MNNAKRNLKDYMPGTIRNYSEDEIAVFASTHIPHTPKPYRFDNNFCPYMNHVRSANLITNMGPYDYMITVTFTKLVSEAESLLLLKELQAEVDRYISQLYGPNTFIQGIAIKEPASILNQSTIGLRHTVGPVTAFSQSWHFHLLIRFSNSIPDPDLVDVIKEAYKNCSERITYIWGLKNRTAKIAFSLNDGIHVVRVEDQWKVAEYVTKEARSYQWKWVDRVYYLGKGGVS